MKRSHLLDHALRQPVILSFLAQCMLTLLASSFIHSISERNLFKNLSCSTAHALAVDASP